MGDTPRSPRSSARADARGEPTTVEVRARPSVDESSQAALVVLSGGDVGRFHRLPALFCIGRGNAADLQITGPGVSRRHAEIIRQADGSFLLRDLDSHNGTLVNGRPVQQHALRFGDQIDIGVETRLRFVYRDEVDLHLQESQRLEAVGQLAGGIAHEFNNLLAVVLGNLTVVRDQLAADSDMRGMVDDCVAAARRGADLTRDLLSFARRSDVSRHPVDVGELVRSLSTVLRGTFDRAIQVTCDSPTGLVVLGDGARLQQVLLNMAVNARDAMPRGGQLDLSVDRVAQSQVAGLFASEVSAEFYVRIRLRDSGHGMDAATQSRIFEPFFTTKEIGRGTGLGLALAHGIVGSHHGTILVDSTPGAGTTFTIILPQAQSPATAAVDSHWARRRTLEVFPDRLAAAAAAEEALPSRGAARQATVLVIDDEPAIRRLTEHVLWSAGFRVLQAGDGAQALQVLRQAPGAVGHVLLDINMAGLDGEQAYAAILELEPTVHVVLCSGNPEDARVLRLRQRAGVTWLAKPFEPTALLAAMGSLTGEA